MKEANQGSQYRRRTLSSLLLVLALATLLVGCHIDEVDGRWSSPLGALLETPTGTARIPDRLDDRKNLTAVPKPALSQPPARAQSTPTPAEPTYAVPYVPSRARIAATTAAQPPFSNRTPAATPLPTPPSSDGTPSGDVYAERLRGPASVPLSPRYDPIPLRLDTVLEQRVRALLDEEVDSYGIVVKRLTDGLGIAINSERPFYAASLFKLEVMYEVFKQRSLGLLSFSDQLAITSYYADYDLGTLEWPVGSLVSIGELLESMIIRSDNASAILLQDKVGAWNLNADMKAMGLTQTVLSNEALTTSAADMALLLEAIARGKAVDEASSWEMVDLLVRQTINDRLPLKLPKSILVAHKTGNWDNATHDVGIVYAPSGPYVIVVLSDKPWDSATIAELSLLVYEYLEGVSTR